MPPLSPKPQINPKLLLLLVRASNTHHSLTMKKISVHHFHSDVANVPVFPSSVELCRENPGGLPNLQVQNSMVFRTGDCVQLCRHVCQVHAEHSLRNTRHFECLAHPLARCVLVWLKIPIVTHLAQLRLLLLRGELRSGGFVDPGNLTGPPERVVGNEMLPCQHFSLCFASNCIQTILL